MNTWQFHLSKWQGVGPSWAISYVIFGIICHIERTKGGDLILKGESQTPLETMVKKENIDLKWVRHSTNNDWFKLLQNLDKSRFNTIFPNTANC